ncbi:DNA helicase PIF1, ATP-dependent [Tanacetum coccineum]
MARDWCNTHNLRDFQLRLHSERKTTRQYNAPTVSEVAAIIIIDFGDAHPTRDIVIERKDTGPQRFSELHLSYMTLHYPLIFLYGEDGFHENIPYHANAGTRKTKRGYVTMKEYYSYIIHQRHDQGNTLLKGRRLFQQYLVDAYTAVEEQRLKWTRNNQDTLRVDLYHNLVNELFCQGPLWEARVVYVIEFQKRGLPHAHILLWLEEHCKCKTPSEVDDIILAEMPSPTVDLDGYKVVTNNMLHGPCGKDVKNAACTTDGKCSKHFPKPYLAKTFLDEDGYPHYRQRDNKVTFKKGKFIYDNKHVVPHNRYLLLKIVYSSLASEEHYYLRMLLNVVRGVFSFEELMTVNKRPMGIRPTVMGHIRNHVDFLRCQQTTQALGRKLDCPIRKIVVETYPDFTSRQTNNEYLKERAILTPWNDDADAINEFMFKQLSGKSVTYNSADEVCMASNDNIDQNQLYLIEFLNSLNFPGMPPHELHLKKELPVLLLRNLNPSQGLCNGTRLIITDVGQFFFTQKS